MHQVPEIGAGGSGARLFLRRYGPGAIALALGTAASVGLFGLLQQAERNEAQVRFLEAAAGPLGDLRAAVESSAAAGRTLACAWGAQQEARDEDFGLMALPFLDRGLGIRAMAWVPRVAAADRVTFEAEAGQEGRAGLPLSGGLLQGRPARQGDAVASPARAADRAESWPVRLVAAGQGEEVALGTDLGADPVCLAALERAGETGQPCATGRLSSVRGGGGPGRTIVFCPVYRQGPGDPRPGSRRGEPGGFIAVYLSAADLVRGATASPDFPDIEIRLYDNSSPAAARLIARYARAPSPGSEKVSGTLSRRVPDTFSDPAGPPAVPREERMAVEKLAADGGVLLWVDDRRGTAERLIYQRDPELLRLYRGTQDWARLWQENEATQEFGEIVARIITFEPATGLIEVEDQQSLMVSPRPKPAAPAKAGPRPMFQP
jgi:CHASE1-domain containing sensor protein